MAWYVVDGMDGSGKSTVAGILKGELEARGRSVLVIAHPNRDTVVGRMELRFLRGDGRLDVIMSTILYVADVLHSLRVMRGRKGRGYDDVIFVRYIMAVAYLPDRMCDRAYGAISRIRRTLKWLKLEMMIRSSRPKARIRSQTFCSIPGYS